MYSLNVVWSSGRGYQVGRGRAFHKTDSNIQFQALLHTRSDLRALIAAYSERLLGKRSRSRWGRARSLLHRPRWSQVQYKRRRPLPIPLLCPICFRHIENETWVHHSINTPCLAWVVTFKWRPLVHLLPQDCCKKSTIAMCELSMHNCFRHIENYSWVTHWINTPCLKCMSSVFQVAAMTCLTAARLWQ